MADDWGPWIDHDGKGLPDAVRGQVIEIVDLSLEGLLTPSIGQMPMNLPPIALLCWTGGGWFSLTDYAKPIIRYRIRKPRWLRQLQQLVADPGGPVVPDIAPDRVPETTP